MKKIAIFILLVFSLLVRIGFFTTTNYHTPDEQLTVKVVQYMYEHNTLDDNWNNVDDLPPYFKYPTYNFSSSIYVNYFFFRSIQIIIKLFNINYKYSFNHTLYLLRFLSALLGTATGIFLYKIGVKIKDDKLGILSLLVFSVIPILVQDSHYVRPETFMTLISTIVVYLSFFDERKFILFSCFLVGLITSSKITMILIGIIPFISTMKNYRSEFQIYIKSAVSMISGILFGAPYMIINFPSFINGLSYLSNQYNNSQPPHSSLFNNPFFSFNSIITYYISTFGIISIFILIGIVFLIRNKSYFKLLVLSLPPLLFLVLFSFQKVYFERNLSPITPNLILLLCIGMVYSYRFITKLRINPIFHSKIAIFLILSVLMLRPLIVSYNLVVLAMGGQLRFSQEKYEKDLSNQNQNIEIIHYGKILSEEDVQRLNDEQFDKIYSVEDFNDEYSKFYLSEIARLYKVKFLGIHKSIFADIPTCTLHTYHSPNYYYFLLKGKKEDFA